MKADLHVHFIPAELEDKAGIPVQTAEALWDKCCRSGAERAAIQGWPFQELADCIIQNRTVLRVIQTYPERFWGFCTVSPNAGEAALEEAGACLDSGFSGVGELDPVRQGFSLDHPVFQKLCRLCEERGRLLCLHVKMGLGENEGALPADCLRLIEAHPDLHLLLPHYGGGLPFYALMPEVSKKLGNVWFDTAPEDCALLPGAADCTRLCLGEDRLVYGSHLPGPVYDMGSCWDLPEKWRELSCNA